MQLGDYTIESQLGAGPDGVTYRAAAPDGATVEVVRLGGEAVEWRGRALIAKRVEALKLLDVPGSRRVIGHALAGDAPWVGREPPPGPTLAEERAGLTALDVAGAVLSVVDTLGRAHPLGISGADLRPEAVRRRPGGGCTLDLLDLDAGAPARTARSWRRSGFDPEPDLRGLGELMTAILGPAPPPALAEVAAALRREEPEARPGLEEVARRVGAIGGELLQRTPAADASREDRTQVDPLGVTQVQKVVEPPAVEAGGRIGRYELIEVLGRGGMGRVFRALDRADGAVVAVKVLERAAGWGSEHVGRFRREARILQEVESPHVAALLEVNEEGGVHYMALELVPGRSLEVFARERGRLPEREALELAADVARGLIPAHRRGIVHRDVKPGNVLLTAPDGAAAEGRPRVKVCDFGLGRAAELDDEEKLTQEGVAMGTPAYMAPEQCLGKVVVGPAADVYALGTVIYRLLVGRTPFESAGAASAILVRQLKDTPRPVRQLVPDVSEATEALLARCLAKEPTDRPADAAELLDELERLLGGRPSAVRVHPAPPDVDERRIVTYALRLELAASPRELWPHVSNTERLNRAIGLPSVRSEKGGGAQTYEVRARQVGLPLAWQERPYEWIEGRRLGVLREFSRGPIAWYTSAVELTGRPDGGTVLEHVIRLDPRHLLGRWIAAFEVGFRTRRALRRVYRRIDAAARGTLLEAGDAFEPPARIGARARGRLAERVERLAARCGDPAAAAALGAHLAAAPPQELARLRPRVLARRLDLDEETTVELCLHAAREGLLRLLWDVVCPICRVPSDLKDTLKAVARHARCEVCGLDFELDFARSVELVFRIHPSVRPSDAGVYCVGGPVHFPHVAAQVRLAPGERLDVPLALEEGPYQVRSPQLPAALPFRVDRRGGADRAVVRLGGLPEAPAPVLGPGRQALRLWNPHEQELLVKVERRSFRDEALTAARAATVPLFRELFPGEVLAPDELLALSRVALVVAELVDTGPLYAELGDAEAVGRVHRALRALRDAVAGEGGAVVKTLGDGLVAAFDDAAAAGRAALALQPALDAASGDALRVRAGLHEGAALVAAIDDHLDYFGSAPALATRLPALGGPGEVVVSEDTAARPDVAALWRGPERRAELVEDAWRGEALRAIRVGPRGGAAAGR